MSDTNTQPQPRPILKASDISDELKQKIFEISLLAVERNQLEREMAQEIKLALDSSVGPTWHVVVGKSFGSYVTHEKDYFMYFYIGQLALLVFKTS